MPESKPNGCNLLKQPNQPKTSVIKVSHYSTYHPRAIIIHFLYIFYPILEGQKRFLRCFFCKFPPLCMVSIQEQFIIKSGLWWRAYSIYNDFGCGEQAGESDWRGHYVSWCCDDAPHGEHIINGLFYCGVICSRALTLLRDIHKNYYTVMGWI